MQSFLYEVVARIVAIYLCFDCCRKLRYGFVDGKITFINNDIVDWLLGWSNVVYHRDATPVRYWLQMSSQLIAAVASLIVAIFGWFPART